MKLEREEQFTKVDEANQTIGALQFENNFLAKKDKKLDAELFQVRAPLERTSSAKLDEMLNFQKAAFDKTSLGYDHSLSLLVVCPLVIWIMLCLFLLLLMLNLRKLNPKLKMQVRLNMIRESLFWEHHLMLLKKLNRTITAPLIKSLNLRNLTFVITVEHWDTLVQIVISGLPLNKAIVCHLSEAKINFKTLWLLLENF